MSTKELRKFIGNEEGDLFCAICNRKAEWEDCPIHPDEHFTVICGKCGVEDKDCENYERVTLCGDHLVPVKDCGCLL